MRLICPNCGAQYEVADDVIPDGGRDVQCSNCGHTWFERPGASEAAEMGADVDAAPAPPAEPEPAPAPEPTPEPEPAPTPEPEPTAPEPKARELDPDVADILRKEAEYEQAARQADDNSMETQPDLDLSQDPEEDRRSREAQDRLARLRGEPDVSAAVGAAMAEADAPRRELLPDIEEINSSLRPETAAQHVEDTAEAPRKRGGFRRGFFFVVILALIALAVYVFAPQISAAVPQAEPYLTSYVDWVNTQRLWLDAQVQGLIERAGTEAEPES